MVKEAVKGGNLRTMKLAIASAILLSLAAGELSQRDPVVAAAAAAGPNDNILSPIVKVDVCGINQVGMFVVPTRGYDDAPEACRALGGVLADVNYANFIDASTTAFKCSGSFSDTYIRSWDTNPYAGACLVLSTGDSVPGGSINKPALCNLPRKALCIKRRDYVIDVKPVCTDKIKVDCIEKKVDCDVRVGPCDLPLRDCDRKPFPPCDRKVGPWDDKDCRRPLVVEPQNVRDKCPWSDKDPRPDWDRRPDWDYRPDVDRRRWEQEKIEVIEKRCPLFDGARRNDDRRFFANLNQNNEQPNNNVASGEEKGSEGAKQCPRSYKCGDCPREDGDCCPWVDRFPEFSCLPWKLLCPILDNVPRIEECPSYWIYCRGCDPNPPFCQDGCCKKSADKPAENNNNNPAA